MLYSSNVYNVRCQLYLNKNGSKSYPLLQKQPLQILKLTFVSFHLQFGWGSHLVWVKFSCCVVNIGVVYAPEIGCWLARRWFSGSWLGLHILLGPDLGETGRLCPTWPQIHRVITVVWSVQVEGNEWEASYSLGSDLAWHDLLLV